MNFDPKTKWFHSIQLINKFNKTQVRTQILFTISKYDVKRKSQAWAHDSEEINALWSIGNDLYIDLYFTAQNRFSNVISWILFSAHTSHINRSSL